MKLFQLLFSIFVLICLPVCSTYAIETIHVYIANDSKSTIVIQQENTKKTIAAGERELNVALFDYLPVALYRGKEYVCTWYVHAKPSLSKELIGLRFNGKDCISDYVTNP